MWLSRSICALVLTLFRSSFATRKSSQCESNRLEINKNVSNSSHGNKGNEAIGVIASAVEATSTRLPEDVSVQEASSLMMKSSASAMQVYCCCRETQEGGVCRFYEYPNPSGKPTKKICCRKKTESCALKTLFYDRAPASHFTDNVWYSMCGTSNQEIFQQQDADEAKEKEDKKDQAKAAVMAKIEPVTEVPFQNTINLLRETENRRDILPKTLQAFNEQVYRTYVYVNYRIREKIVPVDSAITYKYAGDVKGAIEATLFALYCEAVEEKWGNVKNPQQPHLRTERWVEELQAWKSPFNPAAAMP